MTRNLLVVLAALALAGCDLFIPRDKDPYQVCGDVTAIWVYNAERTDSFVGGYAQMCYTAWRAPGMEVADSMSDTTVSRLLSGAR